MIKDHQSTNGIAGRSLQSAWRSDGALAWGFTHRQVAVRLFLTCWIIFALHFATNIPREIFPALTLGDHLSFNCAEYLDLHIDVFEVPGRGGYIAGNPGASVIGAFAYAAFRPVIDRVVDHVRKKRQASGAEQPPEYNSPWPAAREFYEKTYMKGLDVKFGLGAGVMQVFCMAPVSALGVVLMYYVLLRLTGSSSLSVWLAVLYAFATPVFYRTAQLNHNLMIGHLSLLAFVALWRPWDNPGSPGRPMYLLAGLLAGWTVVCDYIGLVVVIVIAFYGLFRRMSLPANAKAPGDVARFIAGLTFGAVFLMWYQWLAFDHPLWPAQIHMPPPPHGYRSLVWPQFGLFWRTLLDPHYGLFIASPLLLLALYFPGWLGRDKRLLPGREMRCVVWMIVGLVFFCSVIEYGYMQFNTSVRYIVPAVPFFFLLVAGVLLRMPAVAAVMVGVVATYWSWCLAMYREAEVGLGILEGPIHITLEGFQLPWLTTLQRMGYVLPNGTPIALLLLTAAVIAVLWCVGNKKNGSTIQ